MGIPKSAIFGNFNPESSYIVLVAKFILDTLVFNVARESQ